jgi:hypothetical protein
LLDILLAEELLDKRGIALVRCDGLLAHVTTPPCE